MENFCQHGIKILRFIAAYVKSLLLQIGWEGLKTPNTIHLKYGKVECRAEDPKHHPFKIIMSYIKSYKILRACEISFTRTHPNKVSTLQIFLHVLKILYMPKYVIVIILTSIFKILK